MRLKLFSLIFLFQLAQSHLSMAQIENIDKQLYKEVDSLFNAIYQSNKTGAAFAIIKNGETVFKTFKGLANVEHKIPITDSTVFHIASVSKQFASFIALLLEDEGKLSLEDDIKNYLPELNHILDTITIKDLANHTHGLPNIHELAHLKGVLPQVEMTHREIVELLLNIKEKNFKAKDKYEYNNTGYILLAEIIERISKVPFNEQLKEKIFLPLGMNHSEAISDAAIIVKNKAYSYQQINDVYKNYPLKLYDVGASGINTTINDLIKWAKNYQNIVVGKRGFYDKMEEPTYLNSGKKINYGLGLQFGTYKGLNVVFHGGGDVGYRSYILHIPKYALSIVILANTNDFSPLDVVYGTVDILLKEYLKVEMQNKIELSNTELKEYEGTYEFYPGNYWNIIAENNMLYFQQFGSKEKNPLPTLGKNTFEFPYVPYSKFVFYEDRLDFHISDFTYECFKIDVYLPNSNEGEIEEFIGVFKNEEFNFIYELDVENNKLIVNRLFDSIILSPFTPKSYFSRNLGKLDFVYNSNGMVKGFRLSGQNFKNIFFEKM